MIANPRKRRKVEITFLDDTYLDKLPIQTLTAWKDEQGKVRALYGPVLVVTNPLKVTIHGSCLSALEQAHENVAARMDLLDTHPQLTQVHCRE
jgi:hypothetical protein